MKLSIIYFKESGKFYTKAEMPVEPDWMTGEGESQSINMPRAVAQIKELRSAGKLPGLQSGTWDTFIEILRETLPF